MNYSHPFLAALVMGLHSKSAWNYPGARKLNQIGAILIRYRSVKTAKCKIKRISVI
jgi:hypothetical protein